MIKERIDEILDDLDMFDDDIDKYEYIVDIGKKLKPLDDSLKKDEYLVQGCTSKVWLIPEFSNGVLEFKADSNSVIVKGLVSIITSLFNGLKPGEIIDFDKDLLLQLGLDEIISPTRQNGVFHMIKKIEHYATSVEA